MPNDYTVACYYFPNYHVDARNESHHGPGWTEWELVKRAEPHFKGHLQPKVPLWGYTDEADPQVMKKKIDAAADHGIDVFVFDWYWYNNGPFLQRGLDEGFLGAPNNDRVRFAIMWANHNWVDIHPAKANVAAAVLYPGEVTTATFDSMADHIIERYFNHPSYWNIEGCPYFSIYEIQRFIAGVGGAEAARQALQRFRDKTRRAGFPDLHLNSVVWGAQILPGESHLDDPSAMAHFMGFDSVTSYVWVHDVSLDDWPETTYSQVMQRAEHNWRELEAKSSPTYHPNVTMGWDTSPRTVQSDRPLCHTYPFGPAIGQNTPDAFQGALRRARDFLQARPVKDRILTVNAWNEWTEGSYLEPDNVHGMGYLEAVKSVFVK